MYWRFSRVSLVLGLVLFGSIVSFGQIDLQRKKSQNDMDLPESILETLHKRQKQEEEKEFQEIIKSGEDAVKISEELVNSFNQKKKFSNDDKKKLDKLEKIVKKIRSELGAEEDKEKMETSENLSNILSNIKEKSASLLVELKKRSKFSISVVAIESSNTLWKLVKILKINKN